MLYLLVRWIAGLTLRSYFRGIIIHGRENVPGQGPVIFVSNHPSAFMDPMAVGSNIRRTIHFLAAAEFFGKGLKSWFYQKQLNMIPVYRPSTLPGESHKNEGTFSRCYELLGSGGAILVFPEGNSITEKRIRKLKTGVARMAIGTREHYPQSGDVKIVPVGLNYSNPHRFQSELFVNIGEPLSTINFKHEKSDVIRLTDEIETRLRDTIIHVQDQGLDSVVKKVDLVMKQKFQRGTGRMSSEQKRAAFTFQQQVIQVIQNIGREQSELITGLEEKLDAYLVRLKELGVWDNSVAQLSIVFTLAEILRLGISFPLFLVGFSINALPYYVTVFYFRKLDRKPGDEIRYGKVNPAFKGSVAMGIGMVFFIITYVGLAAGVISLTGLVWPGVILLAVAHLTGLFALRYIRGFLFLRQKVKFRKLVRQSPDILSSVIAQRQAIINELETLVQRSGPELSRQVNSPMPVEEAYLQFPPNR